MLSFYEKQEPNQKFSNISCSDNLRTVQKNIQALNIVLLESILIDVPK